MFLQHFIPTHLTNAEIYHQFSENFHQLVALTETLGDNQSQYMILSSACSRFKCWTGQSTGKSDYQLQDFWNATHHLPHIC